jgi:5-methylcytosine-specific restriction endonuclease McrA
MKLLPPVTRAWREAISRRHLPPLTETYSAYRACLRWDFGFSCAFCLLHESDIASCGVSGWGFMHIEHFVPRSSDPSRINDYENCLYICGRCNRARGNKMHETGGSTLLDPCNDAWERHFEAVADEVRPFAEDRDAAYTCATYDFNDPSKVRVRRIRRITIHQCRSFLDRVRRLHEALLDRAENEGDTAAVELAWEIRELRRQAYWDLLRFQAIPPDHDPVCHCRESAHLALPDVLEEQTWSLPS